MKANENKVKLILLVAKSLSDEQCANILARIYQRIEEKNLLANEVTTTAKITNKDWDESEHPRASDGKFTNGPKANHGASPSQKKPRKPYGEKKLQEALEFEINPKLEQEEWSQYEDSGFLKRLFGLSERPQYDDKENYVPRGDISTNLWDKIPKSVQHRFSGSKAVAEIRKYLDEARKAEKRDGEGQTEREVLLEKLLKIEEGRISEDETWDGSTKPGWRSKPDEDGHFDHNGAFDLQWMVLDQLHELEKIEKKSSLNQKRAERYYEIEDEMDHIEEMYGDRERGVGFNWPDTQDAYEDRKRYRKLKREQKRLESQIDWDEVENPEVTPETYPRANEKADKPRSALSPISQRLKALNERLPDGLKGKVESQEDEDTVPAASSPRGAGKSAKQIAKMNALAKQFEENEDELDHIEEMYGDRERGVGFKWPDTQEGNEARKRYRHLTRQQKTLDRRIDWDLVGEDPEGRGE